MTGCGGGEETFAAIAECLAVTIIMIIMRAKKFTCHWLLGCIAIPLIKYTNI